MSDAGWWRRPRRVTVVVDHDSWILPWARQLVEAATAAGDPCVLARTHAEIPDSDVTFYLGCLRITPPEVLARSRRNLVVHESALPQGRGFAPMTWQVLEGARRVPIALLEAAEEADAGPVVLRDHIDLDGTELCDALRALQGAATLRLCLRYLAAQEPPVGSPQVGEASWYPRRRPKDSALDPHRTLAEQFDLLRVCDNERYPAFFEHRGQRYVLRIQRDERHLPGLDGPKPSGD